jgi:hypothetical protein
LNNGASNEFAKNIKLYFDSAPQKMRDLVGSVKLYTFPSYQSFTSVVGSASKYAEAVTALNTEQNLVMMAFCERCMSGQSKVVDRRVVLHEMFHGIDDRYNITGSSIYLKVFSTDVNKETTGVIASTVGYEQFADPAEVFAEAGAIYVTGEQDKKFMVLFPHVMEFVSKALAVNGVPVAGAK